MTIELCPICAICQSQTISHMDDWDGDKIVFFIHPSVFDCPLTNLKFTKPQWERLGSLNNQIKFLHKENNSAWEELSLKDLQSCINFLRENNLIK